MTRPKVGDVVHYMSHGTPVREDGTQEYESECRAAIVTAHCHPWGEQALALAVLNPTGMFFNPSVPHDPYAKVCSARNAWERRGGTWHWPDGTA